MRSPRSASDRDLPHCLGLHGVAIDRFLGLQLKPLGRPQPVTSGARDSVDLDRQIAQRYQPHHTHLLDQRSRAAASPCCSGRNSGARWRRSAALRALAGPDGLQRPVRRSRATKTRAGTPTASKSVGTVGQTDRRQTAAFLPPIMAQRAAVHHRMPVLGVRLNQCLARATA